MKRPCVFIASAYSSGDSAVNTHFQCKIFDQLLNDGVVWPVAPLWSHFQHTLFPRPYKDWIEYDLAMLPRYDACLRLDVVYDENQYEYFQHDSTGADGEVEYFKSVGKPVFYEISTLYEWVRKTSPLIE